MFWMPNEQKTRTISKENREVYGNIKNEEVRNSVIVFHCFLSCGLEFKISGNEVLLSYRSVMRFQVLYADYENPPG